MGNPTWKLLACPEPRGEGQRFFQRIAPDDSMGVYVCDNSGDDPDHSDDGPLRLVENGAIHIDADYSSVTVFGERGGGTSRCGVTHRELLWLSENGYVVEAAITVSAKLRSLTALLSDVDNQVRGQVKS